MSLKLSAPTRSRGDRQGRATGPDQELAATAGGCQFLVAEGERCPNPALWFGLVSFARRTYQVATCDRHHRAVGKPRPLRSA